jgi:murein DD-endopeptidase MepM/ murein hydrolase activator NlpD
MTIKIVVMTKKLLICAVILFAAFVFINNLAPEVEIVKESQRKIAAPFRYASLLAREPEAKINIPIRNIKIRQIADTFAAPRGSDRKHQGQDIFAPRNTPVFSATEGYVWRIGENDLGGNTVWIIGAGGRLYYYAHLEKYALELKVGDAVTTDTTLGYVGTSGNAKGTPPHLHFGVYTTEGAIDPLLLFE